MENRINKVLNFMRQRPGLSIRLIEREASIPQTTLHRALSGERGLPVKHLENLEKVLRDYGYN